MDDVTLQVLLGQSVCTLVVQQKQVEAVMIVELDWLPSEYEQFRRSDAGCWRLLELGQLLLLLLLLGDDERLFLRLRRVR